MVHMYVDAQRYIYIGKISMNACQNCKTFYVNVTKVSGLEKQEN